MMAWCKRRLQGPKWRTADFAGRELDQSPPVDREEGVPPVPRTASRSSMVHSPRSAVNVKFRERINPQVPSTKYRDQRLCLSRPITAESYHREARPTYGGKGLTALS